MNLSGNSLIMDLIKPEKLFSEEFEDDQKVSSYASLLVSVLLVTLMLPFHLQNDTSSLKSKTISLIKNRSKFLISFCTIFRNGGCSKRIPRLYKRIQNLEPNKRI